jgi:hypothetical protein
MAKTPLEGFLEECVARDRDGSGLSVEELYGLYLSWCALGSGSPVRYREFRAGLRAAGIRPTHRGGPCPGLTMAGPAACDYLVHRELPLAVLDAPSLRPEQPPAAPDPVAAHAGWSAGGAQGTAPAA